MKRFLMFPIVLGIVGAFFYIFCWTQFAIVVAGAISMAISNTNPRRFEVRDLFVEQIYPNFLSSYLAGAIFGAIVGLILAIWNEVRNGHTNKKCMLPQNILWCFFYAFLFSIPNHIIGILYLYGYTPTKFFGVLPLVSLLLLNFTAIIWAAIRSIQTDDILTPRVLRGKLRERSRL